jgi:hypothetical protein
MKWHQGDKGGASGWKAATPSNDARSEKSQPPKSFSAPDTMKSFPPSKPIPPRKEEPKVLPNKPVEKNPVAQPVAKVQPFKDAFRAVGISKEEKEERENELRRAITLAYGGTKPQEQKVEKVESESELLNGEQKKKVEPQKSHIVNPDREERREFEGLKRPPKDPRSVNIKKDPSAENIQQLKEALAKATLAKTIYENKTSEQLPTENTKIKVDEVPEEVLRKLLDVDPDSEENNI